MAAFDLPEPQILLNTPGDERGEWLHVLLLKRVAATAGDTRWMVLTPDLTVEPRDIGRVPIIGLSLSEPFPDVLLADTLTFGAQPSVAELIGYHGRASAAAALLRPEGVGATATSAGPPASWRVCHTGCDMFGDSVPDEVVTGPTGVIRGAMGLAEIDGQYWPVERVVDSEAAA